MTCINFIFFWKYQKFPKTRAIYIMINHCFCQQQQQRVREGCLRWHVNCILPSGGDGLQRRSATIAMALTAQQHAPSPFSPRPTPGMVWEAGTTRGHIHKVPKGKTEVKGELWHWITTKWETITNFNYVQIQFKST